MKRSFFVLIGALGLLLLFGLASPWVQHSGLAQSKPVPSPDPDSDADFDPDLPAWLQGKVDKEEFLLRRFEYVAQMRGLPHNLPYDPRIKAISEMKRAEAKISRRQAEGAWREVGPAPIPNGFLPGGLESTVSGRVNAVAVHPINPDIVYIGTAAGGLFRTLDGGKTWVGLMAEAQSLSIGAISIAPSQPTTVYVGTGEPFLPGFFGVGVYRIDNAETSPKLTGPFNRDGSGTDIMSRSSVSKILVHPTNPNHILVSTVPSASGFSRFTFLPPNGLGLFRSQNAGSASPTFSRLAVPGNGLARPVTDMVYEPGNPDILICAVQSFNFVPDSASIGGIWRSTNAQAENPRFQQMAPLTGLNLYVKLAAVKVDSGVTILAATSEFDTVKGCGSGVFAGRGGALRRSTDSGVTWSEPISGISGYCGTQCFYNIAVAMSPIDPKVIYIGGQGRAGQVGNCASITFARSGDGVTFFRRERGLYADTHAIEVSATNPSIVYTGDDAGIFKSTDEGMTWTSLNTPDLATILFHSVALHPTNRNFCIGGTQDLGTEFRRADGTWSQTDISDGGAVAIDRNVRDTSNVLMYHTYFNVRNNIIGFLRVRTTACAESASWDWRGCGIRQSNKGCADEAIAADNGINCNDNTFFYAPMELGPGNPNTLYFGTEKLYRSTDAGDTMAVVGGPFGQFPGSTLGVPITAIGISPVDDNLRVVGLNTGKVFRTTTGSTTFDDISGPIPAGTFVTQTIIDPTNDDTAYVTLNGYGLALGQHIWKTTNLRAGRPTWRPSSIGIPDVPVNDLVVDSKNPQELYAATDIGVFRSLDGGKNWEPFSTGLPRVPVFNIALHPTFRFLRIATHGRGMWDWQLPRDPDTAAPVVQIVSPNGGEVLMPSSSFEIKWTSQDDFDVKSQDVGFSTDGGTTFSTAIATGLDGAASSFAWAVPDLDTLQGRIRVSAIDEAGNQGNGVSAGNFSITGNPDFSLIPTPASQSITAGATAEFMVSATGRNGFRGTIGLEAVLDVPVAGVTVRLSSNSVETDGLVTLTVETTPTTPGGTLTVRLKAMGGQPLITRTTVVSIAVQSPDFELGFDSSSITLRKGEKIKVGIKINRTAGFSGAVTVTPPDTRAQKLKITPSTQSTSGVSLEFTIKAKSGAAAGTYPVTFSGQDSTGRTRMATLNLVVQ